MTAGRKRRTSGWLTAAAFVLVLLGAYVGGYFWLGAPTPVLPVYGIRPMSVARSPLIRTFPHPALATVFHPMGWIECRARDRTVILMDDSNVGRFEMFAPP